MKKNAVILVITLIFSGLNLSAQETFQPRQAETEQKGYVYQKEFSFDFGLQSNGFFIGANWGKLQTYYKTRYFHVDFGQIKHPREVRITDTSPGQVSGAITKSYIYGKQNNLYVLRAGMGNKRYFSEKAKKKGVAVGLSYEGGLSLGLVKPYYIDVNNPEFFPPVVTSISYGGQQDSLFLQSSHIVGSSGWTSGLSEIQIYPGLHAKVAVHFDWGAFDEYVKALEAGFMLDVYSKKVPIMVENASLIGQSLGDVNNTPLFINVFLNLQLGKRR